MLEIELIGGPFDGEIIYCSPAMNAEFFIEKNSVKHWYSYTWGKAYYRGKDKNVLPTESISD